MFLTSVAIFLFTFTSSIHNYSSDEEKMSAWIFPFTLINTVLRGHNPTASLPIISNSLVCHITISLMSYV